MSDDLQRKLADACMWYRHDFGLLGLKEREAVLRQAA